MDGWNTSFLLGWHIYVSFREGTTFETVGCVSDRQKKPTLAGSLGKSLAVAFVPEVHLRFRRST